MTDMLEKQRLKKALTDALLHEEPMDWGLYQCQMEKQVPEWLESMRRDRDDFLLVILAQKNNAGVAHAALVLLEFPAIILINEAARERLQSLWQDDYVDQMRKLMRTTVSQLLRRQLPIYRVTLDRGMEPILMTPALDTDPGVPEALPSTPTKPSPPTVVTVTPLFSEPLTAQEATDLRARMAAMKDSAFASLQQLVMQESQRRDRQKSDDLLRTALQQLVPASAPLPEKPVKPPRRKPR